MIETPWGPREIYDPTQDAKVVTAFKRIYNQNDPNMILLEKDDPARKTFSEKDAWHNPEVSNDVDILFKALDARRNEYKQLPCFHFSETESGRWWIYHDGKYSKVHVGGLSTITIGEKSYPNRNWHPIGPHYFSAALSYDAFYELNPKLRFSKTSVKEQFKNFYAAKCIRWFPPTQKE